jgi:acyl carrier protein
VSEIGNRIKDFIAGELMFEDTTASLSEDTPLLGGIIDSLGLMQLISFIEEEFEVAIDDAEVTTDNFRTVGDIEQLVSQKVSA